MIRLAPLSLALAALAPLPAVAADPPQVTTTTTVYGSDPCPKPRGEEIIVCAREPEGERYRIPKRFRSGPRVESGASASWASRVAGLEDAQRFTRPNSCSAIGANGATGCTQAMLAPVVPRTAHGEGLAASIGALIDAVAPYHARSTRICINA